MEKTAAAISEVRGSKLTRSLVLVISLILSIAGYSYVVEFYDPDKNIISQLWSELTGESYKFYSGSEGGFYIQIGSLLQQETKNKSGITITNQPTSGGFENAIKVMNNSSSFGLLQEDTLTDGDFIRQNLLYITPLYIEQMHILYRQDLYESFIDKKSTNNEESLKPILSEKNEYLAEFFREVNISTGPIGSGSKIFSNYLLTQIGINQVRDLNLSLKDSLFHLQNDDNFGATFTMAGGPLESVADILRENKNIKLMSIDQTLFSKLNQNFGLKLRPTTFNNIYEGHNDISTIGSFAFLVSSNDVSKSAKMRLISTLENSKFKMEGYNDKEFPLNQFNFLSAFEDKYEGFLMDMTRNLLIFFATIVVATSSVMTFLVWILSGHKRIKYFRSLTEVYKNFLPENTILENTSAPFPKPIIGPYQSSDIEKLTKGLSELLIIARNVREDYVTGGITISHYKHILENFYEMKEIFRSNLAQHLNEALAQNKEPFSPDTLRHFYTAGYLTKDDYRYLANIPSHPKL